MPLYSITIGIPVLLFGQSFFTCDIPADPPISSFGIMQAILVRKGDISVTVYIDTSFRQLIVDVRVKRSNPLIYSFRFSPGSGIRISGAGFHGID